MITVADASLHAPTSDDPTWAETNFFGFYVPDLALNCGVYTLFRANLGVGLSTPEHAVAASSASDGVIVGSALVRRLLEGGGPEQARALVASFRQSLDA